MGVTVTQLEDTVRDWLVSVVGHERVFFENEMGPPPTEQYLTILLSPLTPLPWDIRTFDLEQVNPVDNTETIRGAAKVNFKISIWGGNDALAVLNKVRNSLAQSSRWTDLWAVMGKSSVSDIINLSTASAGKVRQRYEINVAGYANITDIFNDPDFFDKVQVTCKTPEPDFEESFTVGTDIPPPTLDQSGC